jgi:hypothetical protein
MQQAGMILKTNPGIMAKFSFQSVRVLDFSGTRHWRKSGNPATI